MLDRQVMQEFFRTDTMPYFNDRRALQEMWEFCSTFPAGSKQYSAAAWTQSYVRSGRMPPVNLRAALIQAALDEGWKPGITSFWQVA